MRGAYLLLVLALGCGPGPGEDQVITLEALGLHLTENPYALKPGALVRADNASIERVGVIQSARGWQDTGMTALSGEQAKAGTFFQDKLVFQHGTSGLSYLDGSTRTAYSGTFTPPTGRKTRFAKAGESLYFTTSAGVKKLTSYDATPTSAGGVRPIHLTATTTGTEGFLGALRSTAFRVVWSVKDANGYVIQGPPSQYEIVSNSAIATSAAGSVSRTTNVVTVNTDAAHGLTTGEVVYIDSTDANFPAGDFEVTVTDTDTFTFAQTGTDATSAEEIGVAYTGRDVSLTVNIPSEITSTDQGYYAEVFRSYDQTPDALSTPTDEMGKVLEYRVTNVDIANGYFTFTDSTPDALVQVPLYTNATEEGLAQANDPPPVCTDLAQWSGHMFCADSTQYHSLVLTLLSAESIPSLSRFQINRSGTTVTLFADATEDSSTPIFKVYTDGTPAENVANTAKSLVRVINANATASSRFVASYLSGPNDPPGTILIQNLESSSAEFNVNTALDGTPRWAPHLLNVTPGTFTRVSDVTTFVTTAGYTHGFVTGQNVWVGFGSNREVTVTVASSSEFTFSDPGSDTSSAGNAYTSNPLADDRPATSSADDLGNRLYYSKYGLPEAVPALNYIDVGAPDDTIRRIVPLRDSLFIFMEKSGLWRLSGQEPFYLDQFDSTVRLLGDENLAVLDNKIVALTAKGVVTISESGVSRPISYPIEKGLLDLTASALSAVKNYGFALALESSRKFVLYLPEANSNTSAKQKFVYHLDSGTWVEGTDDAYFGAMDETNDVLYLSRGTTIEKERKARTTADYQNSDASGVGFDIKWAPFTAGDLSVVKHWPEISVLLTGNSATTFTAGFSTDLSTSEETVSVTGVPANGSVRVSVPLEKQRGGELNVRLTHSTASECLSVAGLKIKFSSTGGPVNR